MPPERPEGQGSAVPPSGIDRRERPRTEANIAQTAYLNGIRRLYNENAENPVFLDNFSRLVFEKRREASLLTPSKLTETTPPGDIDYSIMLEVNAIQLAAAEARVSAAELESMKDPLTGALNRRGFNQRFANTLEHVNSTGMTSTLVQLDLDHFKAVNDAHGIGHEGGDIALIGTVQYIQELLGPEVTVARAGGEEFYIILPDVDTAAARIRLDEIRPGLRDYLRDQLQQGGKKPEDFESLALTASWGIAAITPQSNIENVTRSADIALYAAKESGRNKVMSITDADVSRIDTSGIALRDIQAAQDNLERDRRETTTPPSWIIGDAGNSQPE